MRKAAKAAMISNGHCGGSITRADIMELLFSDSQSCFLKRGAPVILVLAMMKKLPAKIADFDPRSGLPNGLSLSMYCAGKKKFDKHAAKLLAGLTVDDECTVRLLEKLRTLLVVSRRSFLSSFQKIAEPALAQTLYKTALQDALETSKVFQQLIARSSSPYLPRPWTLQTPTRNIG